MVCISEVALGCCSPVYVSPQQEVEAYACCIADIVDAQEAKQLIPPDHNPGTSIRALNTAMMSECCSALDFQSPTSLHHLFTSLETSLSNFPLLSFSIASEADLPV